MIAAFNEFEIVFDLMQISDALLYFMPFFVKYISIQLSDGMFIEEIVLIILFHNYLLYHSDLICIYMHLTRYKLPHNC